MGQQGGFNGSMRNINSIVGAVHTTDNHPLNNVRVELRDASTGAIVGSSYTGMGGSFEFRQLQQGPYEVLAASGASQVQERVQVNSITTNVDLRLPVTQAPNDGIAGRTVSVNQYRVPESARQELRKAQEAASKHKDEEVAKHLERALEIHPTYADALSMRAALKLDNKDIPGAMQDAQKAIDSDGNYALAYTVMGSALNVQMKFDEALRSLERAESLAPDIWQTYFEIGRAYLGKKDYAKALEALDRAQRLAPDYTLIQLVRAHCLMALGRNSEAAAELQGYLTKNPKDGRVEQAKNMLAQAQAAMERSSN
jgi:tetratricopeptide (TPR) repeat protein